MTLADDLDRLWAEWKFMKHLPEADEKEYLDCLWFFSYLKKGLTTNCVEESKGEKPCTP